MLSDFAIPHEIKNTHILPILTWLEKNILLEGTLFDKWIAAPAKKYYIGAKRLE